MLPGRSATGWRRPTSWKLSSSVRTNTSTLLARPTGESWKRVMISSAAAPSGDASTARVRVASVPRNTLVFGIAVVSLAEEHGDLDVVDAERGPHRHRHPRD